MQTKVLKKIVRSPATKSRVIPLESHKTSVKSIALKPVRTPIRPANEIANETANETAIEPELPYSYNSRGWLVYKDYTYNKTLINGAENIIYWRCTEYKRTKCSSTLKTIGKNLNSIKFIHNHPPRNDFKKFKATVYNSNE